MPTNYSANNKYLSYHSGYLNVKASLTNNVIKDKVLNLFTLYIFYTLKPL